ncbi:MAG: hypothetical protein ACREBA_10870, partial [Nitrosotalea sp.]
SEGNCGTSSMNMENSRIQVSTAYNYTINGNQAIMLDSKNLQCSMLDLGPAKAGERVVFNCLKPFGSGISSNAVLEQP